MVEIVSIILQLQQPKFTYDWNKVVFSGV